MAIQDEQWVVVGNKPQRVVSEATHHLVTEVTGSIDAVVNEDRSLAIAALPDLVRALQVLTHAGINATWLSDSGERRDLQKEARAALRKAGVLK